MIAANPFTERARITNPDRFTGRWGELSLLFDQLEAGVPVIVTGAPGVGKSSLLTHVMQSAAATMDLPNLRAYYLDLAVLGGEADVYRLVVEALRQRGDTLAAFEVALVAVGGPVLLCLDNAQAAIAASWGEWLLERLARVARGADLLLVAALDGPPPILSERFVTVSLGAFAPTEVGLFTEVYLGDTGVQFTPDDLRAIADLSAGHPAYLQRAAYYLYQSKLQPELNWRAAYLEEARERPVPGAPLPPAVFEGAGGARVGESSYGDEQGAEPAPPQLITVPEAPPVLLLALPALAGLLFYLVGGNPFIAVLIALIGTTAAYLVLRRG